MHFPLLSGLFDPGSSVGSVCIAFFEVLLIDVALAGDNAVIVGMAVAGLPEAQQRRAIVAGIGAAAVIRIILALVTVQLLALPGMTLLGGLMLLYVCYGMLRDLRRGHDDVVQTGKTLRAAVVQIIIADISMSLDNVLAVAGAAEDHPAVLVAGLALSVLLMGFAAKLIATLLDRVPAIAWAGLAIVLFVALRMVWYGAWQVAARFF